MRRQRGFTTIELLIVVAIIGVVTAIAIPNLQDAQKRGHIGAVAGDARTLYTAFKQFYVDNGMYPNCCSSPSFQLDTFDPLRSGEYYTGNITKLLEGGQADDFDSPDDMGSNQEFWIELTLKIDTGVRFVVADSNNAPLGSGQWLDGVYKWENGVLEKL